MSAINAPENLIIREFSTSKQVKLFDSLLQSSLTGYITFINPLKQNQWYFSLYKGQVLYATDNRYFLRRWQRNLASFLPQIDFDPSYIHQLSLDKTNDDGIQPSQIFWEYELLHNWVENQKITFEQAQDLIYSTVTEILFDITQGIEVICRVEIDDLISPLLAPISLASVIPEVQKQWQEWQGAMIADRSPNLAPVVLQPNQLKERTATQFYQNWSNLLNGDLTLRDIALTKKIPTLNIIQFLLPYIQSGIIGLVEVEDRDNSDTVLILDEDKPQPLIACIDDSRATTSMIEQIFAIAGYRFMAINDPLEAISYLKDERPDLILLDVNMPEMDGYELCSQLRQNPNFANTPIIFLTSSDNVIDRIKSRMMGASHFLQKTVDADQLIHTINQYLPSAKSDR